MQSELLEPEQAGGNFKEQKPDRPSTNLPSPDNIFSDLKAIFENIFSWRVPDKLPLLLEEEKAQGIMEAFRASEAEARAAVEERAAREAEATKAAVARAEAAEAERTAAITREEENKKKL